MVELLSVSTSPAKVLQALTRHNICALLKKSCPDDSLSIATEILKHQTYISTRHEDRFLSPYRTALWMTVCYKPLDDPAALVACMGASPAAERTPEAAERGKLTDWREEELVDSIIWASTHMQDMVSCRSDDDPKQRSHFLKCTLLYLSQRLLSEGEIEGDDKSDSSQYRFKLWARIPKIWGAMFAPLLSKGMAGKTRRVEVVKVNPPPSITAWLAPHGWSIAERESRTGEHM